MLGLTSLEVYNSIFNKTGKNSKFDLYTDPLESEFSFTELKTKVAEMLGLSDISLEDLEHEKYRPDTFKTFRRVWPENSQTDS